MRISDWSSDVCSSDLEIRGAIVQGRLGAGERLVYRTIAEEFGISPTPVRDAIQRLVSDGALVLDDRGVAHVPVIEPETYTEILNLRLQLEGNAAAEVAGNAASEGRSEERRVGKECVSTCRSRW